MTMHQQIRWIAKLCDASAIGVKRSSVYDGDEKAMALKYETWSKLGWELRAIAKKLEAASKR